jgi:hypothetical protein
MAPAHDAKARIHTACSGAPGDCQRMGPGTQPRERRRGQAEDPGALREGLTPAQRDALRTLEHFGWALRFVRRPLFQDPLPVVVDRHGQRHALLRADGSLDESPAFRIRD